MKKTSEHVHANGVKTEVFDLSQSDRDRDLVADAKEMRKVRRRILAVNEAIKAEETEEMKILKRERGELRKRLDELGESLESTILDDQLRIDEVDQETGEVIGEE